MNRLDRRPCGGADTAPPRDTSEVEFHPFVGRFEAESLVETQRCRPRLVGRKLDHVAPETSSPLDGVLDERFSNSVPACIGGHAHPFDEGSAPTHIREVGNNRKLEKSHDDAPDLGNH